MEYFLEISGARSTRLVFLILVDSRILGISLDSLTGEFASTAAGRILGVKTSLDARRVIGELRKLFEDKTKTWILKNYDSDSSFLGLAERASTTSAHVVP